MLRHAAIFPQIDAVSRSVAFQNATEKSGCVAQCHAEKVDAGSGSGKVIQKSTGGVVQLVPRIKRSRWDAVLHKVEVYANKVRPSLEDDDDIDYLETLVTSARNFARRAKDNASRATTAGFRPGRLRTRSASKRYYSSKRLPIKFYKNDYEEKVDKNVRSIFRVLVELKREFKVSSGSFSAKGRAHDDDTMGAETVLPGNRPSTGKRIDNTYLSGVTLNGQALTNQVGIAKNKPKNTFESAGPVTVGGKHPNLSQGVPPNLLGQTEARMTNLNTNGAGGWTASYTGTPIKRGRGAGQYANMANTNATGYAWMLSIPGWQSQRWEWLHVRGAGLGGFTNGTNLVVGTRDSNTHMMPFEANVSKLGTIARTNSNFSRLDVRWTVGGKYKGANHAPNRIQMNWKLNKSSTAGQGIAEPQGQASFNPLVTGTSISKKEVVTLETALKSVRDNL